MYLSQHNEIENSFAIACLNCLTYFYENLSNKKWQKVLNIHLSEGGDLINYENFMKDLGLKIDYVSKDCNRPPFLIHHFTKYTGLQTSLVVDVKDEMWTIANPDGVFGDEVIEVNKNNLDIFLDIAKGGGCKKLKLI